MRSLCVCVQATRSQTVVKLSVVSCPPVVEVVIRRPHIKYSLGFSVQNGIVSVPLHLPHSPTLCLACCTVLCPPLAVCFLLYSFNVFILLNGWICLHGLLD